MAKATAKCTCSYCGKEFEVSQKKRNRADADSWKNWAEMNYDTCPACYYKQKQKAEEEKAAKYNLPEIYAVSEKQKAYAAKMRTRYVAQNEDEVNNPS